MSKHFFSLLLTCIKDVGLKWRMSDLNNEIVFTTTFQKGNGSRQSLYFFINEIFSFLSNTNNTLTTYSSIPNLPKGITLETLRICGCPSHILNTLYTHMVETDTSLIVFKSFMKLMTYLESQTSLKYIIRAFLLLPKQYETPENNLFTNSVLSMSSPCVKQNLEPQPPPPQIICEQPTDESNITNIILENKDPPPDHLHNNLIYECKLLFSKCHEMLFY